MNFQENLRSLRKEKDYSQEYLANKLDVTRQTVSKWENGTAMPDLKKLAGLADLFGVSMDTLLGIEHTDDFTAGNSTTTDQYDKYLQTMLQIIENNQNQYVKSKIKTIVIIFSFVIIAVLFIIFTGQSAIYDRLESLQNNIIGVQSRISEASYDDVDDNDEDNGVDFEILEINKEKQYLATIKLSYSPQNYTKNTKVYVLIPTADNSSEKKEAVQDNGIFSLKCEVDLSVNKPYYIIQEDGDNVTKIPIEQKPIEFLPSFSQGGFVCSVAEENNVTKIRFDESTFFEWCEPSSLFEIVKAELVVEADNKVLAKKELKFSKNNGDNGYLPFYDDVEIKGLDSKNRREKLLIYIRLTDINGIEYECYTNAYNNFGFDGAISDASLKENEMQYAVFYVDGNKVRMPLIEIM